MTPDNAREVFDFKRAIADDLVTHTNIKQELVITTIDKLKLCLIEHKDYLRSRREWLGPLGLLVALLATLVAAEFQPALGLDAATWQALFLISAVVAGVVTAWLIVRALRTIRRGGIDKLIDKIADRSNGGVPQELYMPRMLQLFEQFDSIKAVDLDELKDKDS